MPTHRTCVSTWCARSTFPRPLPMMTTRPQSSHRPMTTTPKFRVPILSAMIAVFLLGLPNAPAQDSPTQPALGDVVRKQKEQRQQSKPAKRVVTDEDMPSTNTHTRYGQVAEYKIIPAIMISGTAPNGTASSYTAAAPKKGQLYIGFGPSLLQPDSCGIGQLDCAEEDLLRTFQRGSWAGSRTRVLFDSDDMVQEYHARVTHFE